MAHQAAQRRGIERPARAEDHHARRLAATPQRHGTSCAQDHGRLGPALLPEQSQIGRADRFGRLDQGGLTRPAGNDDRQTLAQGQLCDFGAQQDELTFQARRS